jgi:hypothetical protein
MATTTSQAVRYGARDGDGGNFRTRGHLDTGTVEAENREDSDGDVTRGERQFRSAARRRAGITDDPSASYDVHREQAETRTS